MSDKSKAAAIAAQTSKVIQERYKQDEVFYKRFSDKIKALLEELKNAKAEDIASLFAEIKKVQHQVEDYEDSDIPEQIKNNRVIHPFYRNIKADLSELPMTDDDLVVIAEHIVEIIRRNKIVDFEYNITVRRNVLIEIEDYLLDETNLGFSPVTAERIAVIAWNIAVENKAML